MLVKNVNQVIDYFRDKEVLGEITIVIRGRDTVNENFTICELELKQELSELIEAGLTLSQASKYLAKKNNIAKSYIYKMY